MMQKYPYIQFRITQNDDYTIPIGCEKERRIQAFRGKGLTMDTWLLTIIKRESQNGKIVSFTLNQKGEWIPIADDQSFNGESIFPIELTDPNFKPTISIAEICQT